MRNLSFLCKICYMEQQMLFPRLHNDVPYIDCTAEIVAFTICASLSMLGPAPQLGYFCSCSLYYKSVQKALHVFCSAVLY